VEPSPSLGSVPHLGSGSCLGDPHLGTETVDQALPRVVIEGAGRGDVEAELDARVRPVGMLATRAARGVEPPLEL